MKARTLLQIGSTMIALALLFSVAVPMAVAGKGNAGNPGILPPQSKPFGKSYGEWSAEHWKWLFSMPIDRHPLYETAGCDEMQSGPVWFLGGTMASSLENGVWVGFTHRQCTIPAGKAIFFPILDSECATLEGNGETEAPLRACAEANMNYSTDVACWIDGVPVKNLEQYRVQSPLFTYGPLPENNALWNWGFTDAVPGATSPSVSDGIFLMLAPLSVGQHTIHFTGAINIEEINYSFVLDVTYELTIAPPGK